MSNRERPCDQFSSLVENIRLWFAQANKSKKNKKQNFAGTWDIFYIAFDLPNDDRALHRNKTEKMDQIDGCDQRKMTEIVTQLKLLNIRNFSCVRLSLDGENHIIYIDWPGGTWVCFGIWTIKKKLIVKELRIPRVLLQNLWFIQVWAILQNEHFQCMGGEARQVEIFRHRSRQIILAVRMYRLFRRPVKQGWMVQNTN